MESAKRQSSNTKEKSSAADNQSAFKLDKKKSMSVFPVNKQNDVCSNNMQKTGPKIREIGQQSRAKMHVSCFIKNIDSENALTPALHELLEASLNLQTTSTKILAAHLKRSPATIRAEFQRILIILGKRDRYSFF